MAYYYTAEATHMKKLNDLLERMADAQETANTLRLAHMVIMFGEDTVSDTLNALTGGEEDE